MVVYRNSSISKKGVSTPFPFSQKQIGLTASVIFRNDVGGELARDTITIRNQDTTTSTRSWGYYRILTKNAPLSAARAEIVFLADGLGEQSIDIDDVSFHAA